MKTVAFISVFVILVKLCALEVRSTSNVCNGNFVPPNIIFILADDLGWNDVSYHGSPEIPTPNIDALAASGIRLENYYTDYACTPSRGALLTGKYSIYLGLQHFVIRNIVPAGLPLDVTTMPQHLKRLGYSTHIVGKWHLGFMTKEYTPLYRGFDSFFGFYNGFTDYYDYTYFGNTSEKESPHIFGVDLQNGTTPVLNFRGKYATNVFTNVAMDIIHNHNASKPLFLYLSYSAVHTGNSFMPHQAHQKVIQKFHYITDYSRRTHAAMTSVLDDSIGQVFESLHRRNLLQNSIIIFTSDNGGEIRGLKGGRSTNFPLRGQKLTMFEGGIRVPAIIWSPLFQLQEPYISNQLMHVTDWFPTLYTAAGGNVDDLQNINGRSMWDALFTNAPLYRKHLLYNIDPIYGLSSIRIGDFKLVNGTSGQDGNEWYGPTGFENLKVPQSMDEWVFKDKSIIKDILEKEGLWLVKSPDTWRKQTLICGPAPAGNGGCDVFVEPCLFNISEDPCEHHNIANSYPEKVEEMMKIIANYEIGAMKPQTTEADLRGDPRCFDFAYVPWLDPEFASQSSCL